MTVSPPGNTTVADRSASQVRPAWRESAPIPPPRVRPPTPTVGQLPVGIARPAPASACCTAYRSVAAGIVTFPVALSKFTPPVRPRRSITMAPAAAEAPM
ncbi:hypothetical protein NIIDMKKI_60650 [Mycobacterium kansasii]|uniref:Uncharacterized protein n=1 Tax=Mycobacterium kansasii TaxID=1768 RepID=A0A7G1IM03_MYCKA|nr:hypothetical protein NIIDMKKI_60650 [Mycobacterium kansasii]